MADKISELYELMEDLMEENDLKEFRNRDVDNLNSYHFGLGLWLRNNVLKKDNEIYKLFFDLGIENKDDMSNELVEGFFFYLNGK